MSPPRDLDAIRASARQYRRRLYEATGVCPSRLVVSEEDYLTLLRSPDHPEWFVEDGRVPREVVVLYGMTVVPPLRQPWFRDHSVMEHFRDAERPPLLVWQPLSPSVELLERCRTDLPRRPASAVPCPCGEVVWDLSTYTGQWPRVPIWGIPIVADPSCNSGTWFLVSARSVDPPAADEDPLPPLEDLDEGLTCCDRHFDTFAAFMAHRRRHG